VNASQYVVGWLSVNATVLIWNSTHTHYSALSFRCVWQPCKGSVWLVSRCSSVHTSSSIEIVPVKVVVTTGTFYLHFFHTLINANQIPKFIHGFAYTKHANL
jgi:hypothetical protein